MTRNDVRMVVRCVFWTAVVWFGLVGVVTVARYLTA